MSTFSGKKDKTSGVRVKHIYSDNHNLDALKYFRGDKIGGLNYKMHFKSCGDADVTNTLRPESLKLEVYGVRQPYPVYHSASIKLEYSGQEVVAQGEAIFYNGLYPYSFRFIAESQLNGVILIDKELNFTQYLGNDGEYGLGQFKLFRAIKGNPDNGGEWFNYPVTDRDYFIGTDEDTLILRFNKSFDSQNTVYYYDEDLGTWNDTGLNLSPDEYMKYTKIYISNKNTDPNGKQWDLTTRYSSDPYGYNEVKLLEIIDKSKYDFIRVKPEVAPYWEQDGTKFWFNTDTYDYNMFFASNYKQVTYIGLGKDYITALVNLSLTVNTIPEDETVDTALQPTVIDINQRIEVFPSDKLTGGLSFVYPAEDFTVSVYAPYKTTSDINRQYLDGNCGLKNYRFFYIDFDKMVLTVTRNYDNRVEYVADSNITVNSYSVTNIKEVN